MQPHTSESGRSIPVQKKPATEKPLAEKPLALVRGRSRAPVEGVGRNGSGARSRPADAGIVASLRKSLAEKESELRQASQAAFKLRKQLNLANRQNEALRKTAENAAIGNSEADAGPAEPSEAPGAAIVGTRPAAPPEPAVTEQPRECSREIKTGPVAHPPGRMASVAVATAIIAASWGIWGQMPRRKFTTREFPSQAPIESIGDVHARSLRIGQPDSGNGESRLTKALSRLNNVLTYSAAPAQQILQAARERGLSQHRNVCDFSWNGGQPALRYHEGILIYTQLDDCAAAVENYVHEQKETPAANGRGGQE